MCLLLLALLVVAGSAWARSATPPPPGHRIYATEWLDINKWRCPFYNDGRYGIDVSRPPGLAGGSWPQPYRNEYIFGAGLWFGSLKPNPNTPGKTDTLVSFGYNPNSGGTEMTPTTVAHVADGAGSPEDMIYKYPDKWPPKPRDRWVTAPELDSFVPKENFSLQDMWCAYSDAAPENHISPGKPQDVDIYQTVYGWNYPTNQDIFFIIYQVRNSGTDTLKKCYMGAVMDADIGDAADDMVGLLDSTVVPGVGLIQNVGYAGDANNIENPGRDWELGTPGVVAYKFLESPKRPDGQPLGMTAFKRFTIDIDPVTDPAQYLTMAGFDYRTGVFSPFDSVDIVAADKRFIQCSGPFDLAPGQVERLVVAAIAAPYGGPGQAWANRGLDSLVHLARVAKAAQDIYNAHWLLPGPPLAPGLTLIPADNQVRLVWDNLPENSLDPYYTKITSDTTRVGAGWDPKYRGRDFEGYIVYKSKNGSDWGILAQCDIRGDSVAFTFPPGRDSALPDSLWIKANDTTGIFYTLLDPNVINGFTYYYCVTAYDWNYSTTEWDSTHRVPVAWDTIILRSGLSSNFSTIPRWEAVNYVAPQPKIITLYGDTVNPGFRPEPTVVVPYEVTTDAYELRFLAPTYGAASARAIYQYFVRDARNDSLVLDTTLLGYVIGTKMKLSLPAFNGIVLDCSLRIATPSRAFDTVAVQSGSYPGDKLRPSGKADQGLWAFRGVDFEIQWQTTPYPTARVYDVTNGRVEVPFAMFDNLPASRDKANGWAFVNLLGRSPTDTLKTGTYQVYICGGYFLLNYDAGAGKSDSIGSNRDLIRDGDKWFAHGDRAARTAPAYSVYQLVSTPYKARTDTTFDLGKIVKVVPNPYVIFDAWEKTTDQRFVRFTHLPNECTIRIYTLSGDLVKTIKHKDTNTQPLDVGGTEAWDFTNESPGADPTRTAGQLVASGVYVYHVESPVGEAIGKLVFIH
jgi:hypothetical protein